MHKVDLAIIGGGIAGLWLLHQLRQSGHHAVLFEADALGAGQTGCAQGIIHGGVKYSLQGVATDSALNVADMPDYWRACVQTEGDIDLNTVDVLSPSYYLWTRDTVTGRLKNFFASKLLQSNARKLSQAAFPKIFLNAGPRCQVYEVAEPVLAVPSLLQALARPYRDYIYQVDAAELAIDWTAATLTIGTHAIRAQHIILAAGQGNAELLATAPVQPEMQRRPLHMVMLKQQGLAPCYAHCLGTGTTPRITITTHPHSDGSTVWYLGGGLSETGVQRSRAEQIAFAQQELSTLMPWLDFTEAQWHSFFIDRAEAKQPGGVRPSAPFVHVQPNYSVCWPTKLALTPLLLRQWQQQVNITVGATSPTPLPLPLAEFAASPWEAAW